MFFHEKMMGTLPATGYGLVRTEIFPILYPEEVELAGSLN
jgi:hypothetical protein